MPSRMFFNFYLFKLVVNLPIKFKFNAMKYLLFFFCFFIMIGCDNTPKKVSKVETNNINTTKINESNLIKKFFLHLQVKKLI